MKFSNSTGPLTWSLSEYPNLEQSKAVRQKIHLSLEIFSDWRCTWCTFSFESDHVHFTSPITPKMQYSERVHCPACRTTLIATRFRVAVICPIIQVRIVTFWIFTYHKIWILSIMFCFIWSYWIIYFFSMFGSVLESCELTGVCLLLPWLIKWK